MADVVDVETRKRMMSGIRGKDTKPEWLIRRGLHGSGFRYRLHDRTLPGKPDLVLPRYRAVVFVHGCFWHGHDCPLFKWPKSRDEFWRTKIEGNRERDIRSEALLATDGWRIAVVWECALRGRASDPSMVVHDLAMWLKGDLPRMEIRG